MSDICEHCNGELTDEECLAKRLESAQATIKSQQAALDAVRGLHSHQPPLAPEGHMCVWFEDIQAALNKAENGT